MKKESIDDVEVYYGSGNVFADLGFQNPEEHLLKVQLTHTINKELARRNLDQEEAATVAGLTTDELALLARGRVREFSVECLKDILERLG
jgi:predicted XRE-type DNA-binding protein